jgi:hypothetical protein
MNAFIFLINEHGHYFQISKQAWSQFDTDYLLRAGCELYPSKDAMYQCVMSRDQLALDEVDGTEILIIADDKGVIVEVSHSGQRTEVDDQDINDWLAAYKL